MELNAWSVERSRYVVDDRWLRLRADERVRADGTSVAPYYVVDASPWVSILALHEGQVIVIDEYHHGARVIGPGLPGGAVEAGESPENAAARELEEETGFQARHIIELGSAWANWGNHSNRVHYMYTSECEPGGLRDPLDIGGVTVHLESIDTVRKLGYLTQSFHLAHLFLALDHLLAFKEVSP